MDDLTMIIIMPVRLDWLIGHFASLTEPLLVSVQGPATFKETSALGEYGYEKQLLCIISIISLNFASTYGSGHETVAGLLPGFAINW